MANKDQIFKLSQMDHAALVSAANLADVNIAGAADDDAIRKLLMQHGGFSWSWPLANFVAGLLVLIAAGFIGETWAIVASMVGLGFLVWDIVRTHKRLKLVAGYIWKKTARESFGEIFGILAIGLGLLFSAPLLLVVAAIVLIADGIKEKWL